MQLMHGSAENTIILSQNALRTHRNALDAWKCGSNKDMLKTTNAAVNVKLRRRTALAPPRRAANLASQPLARAPHHVSIARRGRKHTRFHAFHAFPRVHSLRIHPISAANHDHVASRVPFKDQATCRPRSLRRDPSRNEATGQLFTSNAFLEKITSTLAPVAALTTVQLPHRSRQGGRKSDGTIHAHGC